MLHLAGSNWRKSLLITQTEPPLTVYIMQINTGSNSMFQHELWYYWTPPGGLLSASIYFRQLYIDICIYIYIHKEYPYNSGMRNLSRYQCDLQRPIYIPVLLMTIVEAVNSMESHRLWINIASWNLVQQAGLVWGINTSTIGAWAGHHQSVDNPPPSGGRHWVISAQHLGQLLGATYLGKGKRGEGSMRTQGWGIEGY